MFLGSPGCFVIVKNLKRNRQDRNLTPARRASSSLWLGRQQATEWTLSCLHLCVLLRPSTPSEVATGLQQAPGA